MRATAVAALLLFCSAASAGPSAKTSAKWWRSNKFRGGDNVALRVLPAGGGQSQLVQLCSATDLIGLTRTFGVDGTGAACAGSVAVSPVGSPATLTQAICPNGPNCGAVTRQRLSATDQYQSAATQTPATGDAWGCVLYSADNIATATAPFVQGLAPTGPTTYAWVLEQSTPTLFTAYISNGALGSNIGSGALASTSKTPTLICFTYHFVGDTTSVLKIFVNGALGNTLSNAHGPLSATAYKFSANGYAAGANTQAMQMFGAAAGTGLPSDTQMSQLASAVLGSLSGSGGETITFTRASAAGCENEDGSVVTDLPNNRPCVTRAGIVVRPTWTETALRTSELDNAVWNKFSAGACAPAVPVVTANTTDVADPFGGFTAEKIVFPDMTGCSTDANDLVYQSFTATAANWSALTWLRRSSGSGTIYFQTFDNITTVNHTQVACAINSTSWAPCRVPPKTMGAATWNIGIGYDLRCTGCGSNKQAAQTVYAWRTNVAAIDSIPLGGIDASASTATVAVESAPVSIAGAAAIQVNSLAATWVAPSTASGSISQYILRAKKDATNAADLYRTSSGNLGCQWVNAGVASAFNTSLAIAVAAKHRLTCSYDGVVIRGCVDGSCQTSASAFTPFTGPVTVYVGAADAAGNESNGITSDVCIGASTGACQS